MGQRLFDLQERALGRKLGRQEMAVMEIRRTEGDRRLLIRETVALPDRHRVTVAKGNGQLLYAEGYDGESAWVIEGNGPARRVTHPLAIASQKRGGLWLAGRRSLIELRRLGIAVELLPEAEDATGRVLPAARVELDSTLVKWLFLEPETGQILVERDESIPSDDEYQELERHTLSTQEVDGMHFPRLQQVVDVKTGEALAQLEWLAVEVTKMRADDLAPLRS